MAMDDINPYAAADEEAGSYDNRLSLDPNDERWPFVADWEDDEEYTVTLRIRQISPGEFEVLEAETEDYEEGEEENTGDVKTGKRVQKAKESESTKKPGGKGQPIPAILAIIGKNP